MKLLFTAKSHNCSNIWTFVFNPVEPQEWISGQSIRLELPAGYGTEERRFTIASAPYESHIAITTRISDSDFKRALSLLEPGDVIDAYAIEGDFIWTESTLPRMLIAAGIGVTAYVPILKTLAESHSSIPATLLYATRKSEVIYEDLFQSIASLHPEFTYTLISDSRLTVDSIAALCPDFVGHLVYISGPSGMVDTLGEALLAQELPEHQLMRDWFTGKSGWDR